jgi:hypothetical protein
MAAPGHGFGAHDGGSSLLGPMNELIKGFLEFWCLHVVCEAAEAGIFPSRVGRVTMRVPQTAKSSFMPVIDPRLLEGAREPALVELRIVSRAWDRSNIDQLLDVVSEKESNEILQGPGRVPHC